MTQYHYERPISTSEESAPAPSTQGGNTLENRVRSLTDRVNQQADDIQVLQRAIKRLQNEVRVAVNTFNLGRHG